MNLKISLLQILPTATVAGNLSKGIHFCRMAKALGADVALFPEMWSIGYRIYDRPPEVWIREAIPENDRFITTFGELAGELEMAIGITFLEAASAGPRNTLLLFDRHGGKALSYSKVSIPKCTPAILMWNGIWYPAAIFRWRNLTRQPAKSKPER